jgi:hypothetical protein
MTGSGTTSPCTCSRATPPSGKMFSRTWLNLRRELTLNSWRASPVSRPRGTISCQTPAGPPEAGSVASSLKVGYPLTEHASTEHACGKFPVKFAVSTTMERTTPGAPSRVITQSWTARSGGAPPGPRRRRVSQPS